MDKKFRIGDIINFKECNENYGKIIAIVEDAYLLEDGTFIHFNDSHFWEIKK